MPGIEIGRNEAKGEWVSTVGCDKQQESQEEGIGSE